MICLLFLNYTKYILCIVKLSAKLVLLSQLLSSYCYLATIVTWFYYYNFFSDCEIKANSKKVDNKDRIEGLKNLLHSFFPALDIRFISSAQC